MMNEKNWKGDNMNTKEIIYQGVPERTNQGGFLVLKNGQPLSPAPSQKLYNHCPDGFNWGYGGSGPAQLALALLLDVNGNPDTALSYHQKFKWEKIATLDMDYPWKMTESEIANWLQATTGTLERSS
jgi:hypothetical protein